MGEGIVDVSKNHFVHLEKEFLQVIVSDHIIQTIMLLAWGGSMSICGPITETRVGVLKSFCIFDEHELIINWIRILFESKLLFLVTIFLFQIRSVEILGPIRNIKGDAIRTL